MASRVAAVGLAHGLTSARDVPNISALALRRRWSQRAQTGAQVVEHPDYAEWRQRVQEVRVQLNAKKQGMSEKFSSTMHLIERTQMLEKTLKNAMSPQMTASLRFGRGLSAQGIR